jgi:hypothetical protein
MKLIIAADLHLRGDKPRCRLDEDWEETQNNALAELVKITNKYDAKLCVVGDIFHRSIEPPWVVNMFLKHMSELKHRYYTLAGNHDLPYHNPNKINESSFGSTIYAKDQYFLGELGQANDFGDKSEHPSEEMVFIHRLVFKTAKEMPPNTEAVTAGELLVEFPIAKWIFTGDNHRGFVYERKGRHVINPGCFLRQAADFKDYKPLVVFVDTKDDIVGAVALSDKGEMINDEYITKENERKDRIAAFVEHIQNSESSTLDFQKNVMDDLNKVDKETAKMIKNIMNEVNEL